MPRPWRCIYVARYPEAVQLTLVFKVAIHRRALIVPHLPRPRDAVSHLIFEHIFFYFSKNARK